MIIGEFFCEQLKFNLIKICKMEKKLFLSAFLLLVVISVAISAVKPVLKPQLPGEHNSQCPNGCVAEGNGCFCYDWYSRMKEYDWNK
jgi:hypothetical protein